MLLYVVEHYKTSSTPVAATNGDHMATHALTEKKEEERIEKGTFLGMFIDSEVVSLLNESPPY